MIQRRRKSSPGPALPPSAILAILGTLLMVTAGATSEDEFPASDKKWIRGPVSYLASEEETREFRGLKTAEEREAFVESFWSRRDPSPGTEANEFRDRFYQRVESADQALKEKGVPAGWKSDPGRVLILLGPPLDLRTEEGGNAGGPPTPSTPSGNETPTMGSDAFGGDGGGKLILVYGDLTGLGLPENLEVEFQEEGLSYRLATRMDLATDAILGLDPDVLAKEFPAGKAQEQKISLQPVQAPAEAPAAAANLLEGASVQQALLLRILDGEEPAEPALPFDAAVDYYKALGDVTYVAVTVGIDVAALKAQGLDLSQVHPVAALRDTADPENLFLYDTDDLFAPSDEGLKPADDGFLRFQAGDGVNPGQYKVVMGFMNADGTLTGVRSTTLDVPDFSQGIQISSITLAQSWEETDHGTDELKRPYVLGNRKVVPRLNHPYEPGANLVLYYQVYNAEDDGGAPNLRISYNFYQKRGTRYVRRGTAPPQDGVQEQVQIYELPLEGWPTGEYKLKVTVTDNNTGAFAEREVPFEVG